MRHHLRSATSWRVLARDRLEDRQAARRLPALVGATGCRLGCGVTGRTFTPDEDRTILDGRAAGLSWDAIGQQIGTTGKACQHRLARGLQVPDPKPVQVGRSKARSDYDPPEKKQKRDPMPAGADATWRAITAGTVLDGSVYQ